MIGEGGSRLKALDGAASWPAAFVGVVVAGIAGRLRPAADAPLVVRPGGMGDLICAHMAAEEVGVDPRSLLWLIEGRSAGWARFMGLPHELYDEGRGRWVLRLAGRHRVVVDTEQRFGLSRAAARVALRPGGRLFGWSTNRLARLATDVVPYDWDATHEVESFALSLSTALEGRFRPPAPRRRREPVSGPPVVAVGGTHSPSRSFEAREWASWIEAWRPQGSVEIVAAPVDLDLAARIASLVGGRAVLRPAPFDETCRRLSAAEAVLTVDGGMVHVASYFGVPTVAVFTSGRWAKWAPLAQGSAILRRGGLPCQPCTVFGQTPPCPHEFACKRLEWPTDLVEVSSPPATP